jgi:hypothetical protein
MDPLSYTLSSTHLAIAIKSPHLPPASHTRQEVYLLPLPHLTSVSSSHIAKHLTPMPHGAISGITFSPDGEKLAWLEMAKDGYEADKRVLVVYELKKGATERWTDNWDRSPSFLLS